MKRSFFFLLSLYSQIFLYSQTQDAEALFDIKMYPAERDLMKKTLEEQKQAYQALHAYPLKNSTPLSLYFIPTPRQFNVQTEQQPVQWEIPTNIKVPDKLEELAFYPVYELAALIRDRKISSVALTQMYLSRLKRYDDSLHCVITLTEETALQQARQADAEIAAGKYRGPLHGIPYGVKDLLAHKDYKTTWGAVPFKDQVIHETATVIQKLEAAGAVMLAKLSVGELAWGDVWYGGMTRNPWNLRQGSSGSSAGSASATAAGLMAFSIGTETLGSIVSPSTRCGVTGLRPTFGRVSRSGAMTLCWSMDKIGPICRNAYDCALVLDVIRGLDVGDKSSVDIPFNFSTKIEWKNMRVGYLKELFEEDYPGRENDLQSLQLLRDSGIDLVPVALPDSLPVSALDIILSAEAASAFDELTRSGKDSLMVRQIENAWPNVFRAGRFIPAVEYIQANRVRSLLIEKMNTLFQAVDLIVCPSFRGNQLLISNLTGHPAICIPNGMNAQNTPTSITLLGNLYDEASILALAHLIQSKSDWDERHPPLFISK